MKQEQNKQWWDYKQGKREYEGIYDDVPKSHAYRMPYEDVKTAY